MIRIKAFNTSAIMQKQLFSSYSPKDLLQKEASTDIHTCMALYFAYFTLYTGIFFLAYKKQILDPQEERLTALSDLLGANIKKLQAVNEIVTPEAISAHWLFNANNACIVAVFLIAGVISAYFSASYSMSSTEIIAAKMAENNAELTDAINASGDLLGNLVYALHDESTQKVLSGNLPSEAILKIIRDVGAGG